MMVVTGVNDQGEKCLLAIGPDTRESTHRWQSLLHWLAGRGLAIPCLTVADGVNGFWAALTKLFPETRPQCCVVHKIRNVLSCLPGCRCARAKKDFNEIWAAPTHQGPSAPRGASARARSGFWAPMIFPGSAGARSAQPA